MALTVNSNPANIDNSGAFNVTTSLSEDASHVNLRVRCDVTVSAVVVATIEKPKGLPDFDLADILTPHVPGLSITRNGGNKVEVSGGSPLVAYTVLFTEVYEDSSGVTQTGDTDNASGTTYKYVPAVGDGSDFSAVYVMVDSSSKFANLTFKNNVVKFYPNTAREMWILFFTEVEHCGLSYSKDGGAWDTSTTFDPASNWGVVILNEDELMDGVTSNLRIQIFEQSAAVISEILTIYVDNSCIDEREILEFDGPLGGKEYLAFEGKKDKRYSSERHYTKGQNKNRTPLAFYGVNIQTLETRFGDIDNTEYLKYLLLSKNVVRLDASYVDTSVTVLTDGIKISNSELFTNEIEIEYED